MYNKLKLNYPKSEDIDSDESEKDNQRMNQDKYEEMDVKFQVIIKLSDTEHHAINYDINVILSSLYIKQFVNCVIIYFI